MSKALIDLKRANTPPANPLTEPEQVQPTTAGAELAPANNNFEPPVPAEVPQEALVERVSTIGARIPESLHHAIKVYCAAHRVEMQRFVQDALSNHLQLLQSLGQD